MHMHQLYTLQPTESSPGTGNPNPLSQRMAAWSGDTQGAGSMGYCSAECVDGSII